jgi:hypothetical protein
VRIAAILLHDSHKVVIGMVNNAGVAIRIVQRRRVALFTLVSILRRKYRNVAGLRQLVGIGVVIDNLFEVRVIGGGEKILSTGNGLKQYRPSNARKYGNAPA